VEVNDVNALFPTKFMLPSFVSSESNCPISSYKIVQTQSDTALQYTSFQVPSATEAVPADKTQEVDYTFYVLVEA